MIICHIKIGLKFFRYFHHSHQHHACIRGYRYNCLISNTNFGRKLFYDFIDFHSRFYSALFELKRDYNDFWLFFSSLSDCFGLSLWVCIPLKTFKICKTKSHKKVRK